MMGDIQFMLVKFKDIEIGCYFFDSCAEQYFIKVNDCGARCVSGGDYITFYIDGELDLFEPDENVDSCFKDDIC